MPTIYVRNAAGKTDKFKFKREDEKTADELGRQLYSHFWLRKLGMKYEPKNVPYFEKNMDENVATIWISKATQVLELINQGHHSATIWLKTRAITNATSGSFPETLPDKCFAGHAGYPPH